LGGAVVVVVAVAVAVVGGLSRLFGFFLLFVFFLLPMAELWAPREQSSSFSAGDNAEPTADFRVTAFEDFGFGGGVFTLAVGGLD
jgi:hypothetical protein